MEFTFGICTYNSEKYIVETLESIRYQIDAFGERVKVNIVVSDDASSDETVNYVRKWLDLNNRLFGETILLEHDRNHGICFNYCEVLKNIRTQYFLKIDGDDLLGSNNIFSRIATLQDDKMHIYYPFKFNDKEMFVLDEDRVNMFYYSHKKRTHRQDFILMETIKPFITPEVCLKRKYFTENCLKFIQEFTQFEDDTSLYYILKNNSGLTMDFLYEPMVLYRVHNKSLSHGTVSVHQICFLDDLHRLKKIMAKNEKNVIIKIFMLLAAWDTFLMKHRFSAEKSLCRKIKNVMYKKRAWVAFKDKEYSDYCKRIDEMMDIEKEHQKKMKNAADQFISSIMNEKDK